MSEFSIGQKVKATSGESTIVGVVGLTYSDGIFIDTPSGLGGFLGYTAWDIEAIPPSNEEVFEAASDGQLFEYIEDDWIVSEPFVKAAGVLYRVDAGFPVSRFATGKLVPIEKE